MGGARRGRRLRARVVMGKEGIRRGRRLRANLIPLLPYPTFYVPVFDVLIHGTSQEGKILDFQLCFGDFVSLVLGWQTYF
jgi:hypothetical protein